jgi:hypothetical protein
MLKYDTLNEKSKHVKRTYEMKQFKESVILICLLMLREYQRSKYY